MFLSFIYLDYIWNIMTISFLSSFIVLSFLMICYFLLKNFISNYHMKWYINYQILIILVAFAGSIFYFLIKDPQIVTKCFEKFITKDANFPITRSLAGFWLVAAIMNACRDFYVFKRITTMSLSLKKYKVIQNKTLFEELFKKFDIKSEPEICIVPNLKGSPFVFGFFKQKLVIPKAILNLPPQILNSILAHEMVHIRDRDPFWTICIFICKRLMIFNPLIFFVGRVHSLIVEKTADEEAIKVMKIEPKDFIDSLISTLEIDKSHEPIPFALNASRNFLQLKGRIESLMQQDLKKSSKKFFVMISTLSILIAVFISISQARALKAFDHKSTELMCRQLQHEKTIESWLNIHPNVNVCKGMNLNSASKNQCIGF